MKNTDFSIGKCKISEIYKLFIIIFMLHWHVLETYSFKAVQINVKVVLLYVNTVEHNMVNPDNIDSENWMQVFQT